MLDAEGQAMQRLRFQQMPWKHDARSRRYSHSRTFGTSLTLPKSLDRNPGPTTDQKYTLRCTGYGNAANGYFIHGEAMHPDWAAAKVGRKQGRSVDTNGGDPNATMKSERDDGFLPLIASQLSLATHGAQATAWDKWPAHLDATAAKYDTAVAFFKVDGPLDTFDNIRVAIWKAYDPATKRGPGVDAFGTWYEEWTTAYRGIIPTSYITFAGYHRYVFFDWCRIGDTEYLKAKNSYGPLGDNGVYYFPREVVNREFAKWGTTLKILRTLTLEQLAEAKKQTPLGKLWDAVIQAWFNLSEKYGGYVGLYA